MEAEKEERRRKRIFRELVGKDWKEREINKVPSSLRKSLDYVYLVFIGVWIGLSLLGGVILLTILPRLKLS